MNFELDYDEKQLLANWMKLRPARNEGAIGGRYTYSFTFTSLGRITTVTDNCTKEVLDLTPYDSW